VRLFNIEQLSCTQRDAKRLLLPHWRACREVIRAQGLLMFETAVLHHREGSVGVSCTFQQHLLVNMGLPRQVYDSIRRDVDVPVLCCLHMGLLALKYPGCAPSFAANRNIITITNTVSREAAKSLSFTFLTLHTAQLCKERHSMLLL